LGLGRRQRHTEDGVRPELRFVVGPVKLHHHAVDLALVQRLESLELRRDLLDHVAASGEDALSTEPVALAVSKLERFVGAGRCARGNGGPPSTTVGENDLHLDSRVASGIEDLACADLVDDGHGSLILWPEQGLRCIYSGVGISISGPLGTGPAGRPPPGSPG
jgi:hypothetical protein